jgi:hypothetical protein
MAAGGVAEEKVPSEAVAVAALRFLSMPPLILNIVGVSVGITMGVVPGSTIVEVLLWFVVDVWTWRVRGT